MRIPQSLRSGPALLIVSSSLLVAVGCGPDRSSSQGLFPSIDVERSDAYASFVSDAGTTDSADGSDTRTQRSAPPTDAPLDERGPYRVGYREIDVSYQAEADDTDDERTLNVSIWYPTEETEGREAEYYNLLDREEVLFRAEVAPLESMPLLIFSHGNGGIAEQNYFMSEYWASRGWVVVSPDHTGNTIRAGADIKIEAAIYRPQDIRAILDRVLDLEESHPLAGRIDADRIVMSGHSFGGYTTFANTGAEFALEEIGERCENGTETRDYCDTFSEKKTRELFREGFYDPRIDVGIPQAPPGAQIFAEGLEQLRVPTMLMTGGMDRTLENDVEGDPIWEYMKGSAHRRVHLPRGGHFTFSNMCDIGEELIGSLPDRIADDGCSDANIDPDRAFEIINVYALAFARYHFWGENEAVVDGERHPIGTDGFELSVGAN